MACIRAVRAPSWWQVLDGWVQAELVAAAAVLVLVAALFAGAERVELRTAYGAALSPTLTQSFATPAGALSERDGPDVRGATFGDVISQ